MWLGHLYVHLFLSNEDKDEARMSPDLYEMGFQEQEARTSSFAEAIRMFAKDLERC